MKMLSTKWFKKWSTKVGLSDLELVAAIHDLTLGLSTADLGSNLFKVRIKRKHGGKSGGFRTIVVYKQNDRAIFLYGFSKNERDNIDKSELQLFKTLGNDFLELNAKQLEQSIAQSVLFELEE